MHMIDMHGDITPQNNLISQFKILKILSGLEEKRFVNSQLLKRKQK